MENFKTMREFDRRSALLLGVAGMAALFGSILQARANSDGFVTLTSTQLAAMMPQKDFFLVNVHIPYEGEIANTDAFIAYDKIAENLDKLPKDKAAKIVVYCRSGRMSEIAAGELMRLGYTRVSNLSGGMIDWENSGYQILNR